jgi:hypothetical protein
MDVESLLRDALDLKRVPGEPDLGFEARVIRSLSNRPRRRARLVPPFVGLAAVLAIAAVAAPWYLGGTTHGVPAGVTSSPSASPTNAASTATPVPLTHARSWGLTFDYPAAWRLSDAPPIVAPKALQSLPPVVQGNYYRRQVFGYVGTSTPETVCIDPLHLKVGGWSLGVCTSVWSLGPDDVVLRFQNGDISGQYFESGLADPGFTMTTVGGLPALFGQGPTQNVPEIANPGPSGAAQFPESAAGAETVLGWELPGNPTGNAGTYQVTPVRITAAVRGPNTAALVAQVKAVVASIQYDPAVIPLPTDPAALAALTQRVLVAGLSEADMAYPGAMNCFPRQPGSNATTISLAPDGGKLGKPLPVVCSATIEPNIMEGWTITLNVTWDAASDRKAGRWTWVLEVNAYGQGGGGLYFGSDVFPYQVPSGQPG